MGDHETPGFLMTMSFPPERCGGRGHRPTAPIDDAVAVTAGDEVVLSPLGQAFIDALRDDERFRDIIDDPFGDHGPVE